MNNIYLPIEDFSSYSCYIIQDNDTIRAYKQMPVINSNIDYTDYYINSHYIYKNGSQNFGPYSTIPVCLSTDILTNNLYYRNDMPDILLMFLIISIFAFYIPFKIVSRFFKKC